jgi:hypothetical protein
MLRRERREKADGGAGINRVHKQRGERSDISVGHRQR